MGSRNADNGHHGQMGYRGYRGHGTIETQGHGGTQEGVWGEARLDWCFILSPERLTAHLGDEIALPPKMNFATVGG